MAVYDRKNPISIMGNRYPQIMLSILQNMSKSELYKNVVYLGQTIPTELIDNCFCGSDKDYIYEETYTCGKITILFLYERKDFENFIQKTAFRCEPSKIPRSMGAITISGLNNWEKINSGRTSINPNYFKEKDNYQDSIIVLSHGGYSNLENTYTQYSLNQWLDLSLQIRTYHELTHYLCRKKYPTLRNVLLDEIFADCMGLIMAMGRYDDSLAKSFLGISEKEYKKGMRLENYITEDEDMWYLLEKVRQLIQVLGEITKQMTSNKADFESHIDCYYKETANHYAKIFSK